MQQFEHADGDFKGGWIYIMMTAADLHRYKLGLTRNNPLELDGRHKKGRTFDPFLCLEVAYFVPTSFMALSTLEAYLKRICQRRIEFIDEDGFSEWFRGTVRDAQLWLESELQTMFGQDIADVSQFGQGRICRAYASDLIDLFPRRGGPDSVQDWI